MSRYWGDFMEFTKDVINEIENEISTLYESLFDEYIKPKKNIPFNTFLKSYIGDIWDELQNLNEITDDYMNLCRNRRKQCKKRWEKKELQKEEDNNKKVGFNRDVYLTAYLFFEQFKDDPEKCKSVYQVETFEEYERLKINELKKWVEDDEKDVRHYPYLSAKKPNAIETLLKHDIKYVTLKLIKKQFEKNNEMISIPNTMTNLAYDYTNRLMFETKNIVTKKINGMDESFFRNVRVLTDTTTLESYLSVQALKEGLFEENVKMLNAFDKKILTYLMSLQDEEFYRTGTMNVRIGDIVRGIGYTDSEKNYTAVKQSIIKMRYIRNEIRDKKLRTIEVKIFNHANIVAQPFQERTKIVEKDGTVKEETVISHVEFAQLEFSKDFVMEIVKNSTTSVYTRIIEQLDLNISQILVYPMQRERLACWKENPNAEELVLTVNRSYFNRFVIFTTNRRDRQIKLINSGLDEIKKSNFIIKDYNVVGDVYTIYFYPLTEQEIIDLSKNKVPAKFKETIEHHEYQSLELKESIDIAPEVEQIKFDLDVKSTG